jgi:hypothetical protein
LPYTFLTNIKVIYLESSERNFFIRTDRRQAGSVRNPDQLRQGLSLSLQRNYGK